jgi:tetratricopeptide (TPR) repeat protein
MINVSIIGKTIFAIIVAFCLPIWGAMSQGDIKGTGTEEQDSLIAILREAVVRKPYSSMNHYLLGVANLQNGSRLESWRELCKATALDSTNAAAFIYKGAMLTECRQYLEAEKAFHRALSIDTNSITARLWLGDIFYILDRPHETIAVTREALSRLKSDAGVSNQERALLYLNLGTAFSIGNDTTILNMDSAEIALQTAIQYNPGLIEAYRRLAGVYACQGNIEGADRCFAQIILIEPRDAETYNSWGFSLYVQKKYSESINKFAEALLIDSMASYYHRNLAIVYLDLANIKMKHGKFREAKENAEKAEREFLKAENLDRDFRISDLIEAQLVKLKCGKPNTR